MFRHGKHYTWLKIFVAVFTPLIFVNEYLVYYIQSYRWPALPTLDSSEPGNYQVLLFVADPQIQGYQDEPMFPVGTAARWDIDRYLKKTFSYAYGYSQPDMVIFLGDLMDEGSKATPAEYAETLDRFHDVFSQAKYSKIVYIPGDNDIGGEGRDFMTPRKVERFEKTFGNITEIVRYGFTDFVKMDLHTDRLTEDNIAAAETLRQKQTSGLTVIINHSTFMAVPKHFIQPITKRLQPKVIFSAHWHKTRVFTCDDCLKEDAYSWNVKQHDLSFMDSYMSVDLTGQDFMCEFAVPTCSYRMGEKNMGYAVAIIGSDGSLRFTILWLPRRYTMLLSYGIVIVIFTCVYVIYTHTERRR